MSGRKIDLTAIKADIAAADAARARGEYWCWRCSRRKEWYGKWHSDDPCPDCQAGIFGTEVEKILQRKRLAWRNRDARQRRKRGRATQAEITAELNRRDEEIARRHGLIP